MKHYKHKSAKKKEKKRKKREKQIEKKITYPLNGILVTYFQICQVPHNCCGKKVFDKKSIKKFFLKKITILSFSLSLNKHAKVLYY